MTVKELIEHLEKQDPDQLVVMAKDGEGNDYSPLADFWSGSYEAETTWHGTVGLFELTMELREQGYSKEDILKDGVPALILCPTY